MKPKRDYAIVTGSSNAYSFSVIATMNAQNYFGTNADWEVIYDNEWDPAHRGRISNAFPFNVNWHSLDDLYKEIKSVVIDRRTDKSFPIDPWYAYSFLAKKLLQEGKYKAVCVLQGDQFVFVNLDIYFKIAESGIMVTGEAPFSFVEAKDLPFGNDKAVTDRSMCGAFDSINFYSPQHSEIFTDLINFQLEDIFKGESNHPVTCHNRSICKNVKKGGILGLDRTTWVGDCTWGESKLFVHEPSNRVFNSSLVKINGWHTKWWKEGLIAAQWSSSKQLIIDNKDRPDFMRSFENLEHNFNLVKSFMEKFNNMIPEISSNVYQKGFIKRPRYELGES
jgi:hypothetical protein